MWAMIPMLRQRSNGACLGIFPKSSILRNSHFGTEFPSPQSVSKSF
jgi:hypothetical protein